MWAVYDAVRCPTLLLRGEQSDLLAADTARAMRERGPGAEGGLGLRFDTGPRPEVGADPGRRLSVGGEDAAVPGDDRPADRLDDAPDAAFREGRFDPLGAGQGRPVESRREQDELVVEAGPVDAVDAAAGLVRGDHLGPEIDVDDGEPRPPALVGHSQAGPLAGRLAQDLAGRDDDPRGLAFVGTVGPEVAAVRRRDRSAARGDRARRLCPDSAVLRPAEGEADLRGVADEDVDDPAVGTEAAAELPAPDLDVLDARGDRPGLADVGRSRGEDRPRRPEGEREREGERTEADAGCGAADGSPPHPVK